MCQIYTNASTLAPTNFNAKSELKDFEKWLARGGVWAAQPALVMLTTCGTAVPRGLRAATGKDGAVTAATAAVVGEYVGPSDYPTDEALAEMVDTYEALLCWFYLPADGDTGEGDRGIVGSGDTDNAAKAEGGGDYGRNKKPSEHSRSSRGVVCFVAYRDEPKRRPGADASHNGMSKSRLEKNAQEADVEQERNETEEGAFQNSGSSSSGDSNDSLNARKKDVDAEDFEPGPLRVRVVLGNPRTTKQLRKATGVFLSASRNRNPVRNNINTMFPLLLLCNWPLMVFYCVVFSVLPRFCFLLRSTRCLSCGNRDGTVKSGRGLIVPYSFKAVAVFTFTIYGPKG